MMKLGPFAALSFLVGCIPLPNAMPSSLPFFAGSAEQHSESRSESRSERREEERAWVNGEPVGDWEAWEDEEEPEEPRRKRRGETVAKREATDIGATCNRNSDCEMNACLTSGNGLGYCTKMCNSWSDCPSHWKCERPGNAPQKICKQDNW